VLDHPWFAVTDPQGKFAIEGLPVGVHKLVLWHERVGYLDRQYGVAIAAGKTTEIAETYDADRFEGPQAPPSARVGLVGAAGFGGAAAPGAPVAQVQKGLAGLSLLDELLEKKILAVDKVCALTPEQKEKLRLAGKGDIHRALDQIGDLYAQLAPDKGNPEVVVAVNNQLRTAFDSRPADDNSLFAKLARSVLTDDQRAAYEKLISAVPQPDLVRQAQKVLVVQLRQVDAERVMALLKSVVADQPMRFEVQESSNRIALIGPAQEVERCTAILQAIDRPAPPANVPAVEIRR
jgi:hypothetical protein